MRRICFFATAFLLFLFLFSLCPASADYSAPESVTITGGENGVEPTETLNLFAYVYPENARQNVKWESLDPKIATINQNGTVSAKKTGSVYIRAYAVENNKVYGQIKLYVKYAPAPDAITLPFSSLAMKNGETFQLSPVITPESASDILSYSSSDASVASVSKSGLVTARSFGECQITVKSTAYKNVSVRIPVTVTDARVPDLIAVYPSFIEMEPGQKKALKSLVLPESLDASLVWKSNNPDIISVSQSGVVTALKEGSAAVTLSSAYAEDVKYTVAVRAAYGRDIQKITLPSDSVSLSKGDKIPLGVTLKPENASRALVYEFSDPSVASVDENGMLTALRYGETDIRVSYHKDRSVRAQMHISVSDPLHPTEMTTEDERKLYLNLSETFTPSFALSPAGADKRVRLISENESIVRIADQSIITAVSPGVCTVRAESMYNPDLSLEFTVTVHSDEYTLRMPERRTEISGIEENLARIDAVYESAVNMLTKEYKKGTIGKKEYNRRLEIIKAAFEMYDFPWMVTRLEKYWMPENSEDGAKDFKPGIVYYGLPYTSGGNSSRDYTVKRALDAEWYVPSEDGRYYVFNHKNKLYDGRYAGNDCSSFIALALFNSTRYQGEILKTYTLYYDDRLVTTDDPASLLAGDILVRHSVHVIMFLYWADEAHTQAVFIEQGGSEPGINTISTSVYNITDYTENFYHIRVLRSFD